MQMGTLTVKGKETHRTLPCAAVALHREGRNYMNSRQIMAVSCAGPGNTIQALAAGLQSRVKATFVVEGPDKDDHNDSFYPDRFEGRYDCFKYRIRYNTWHLIAVAQRPGLIQAVSDEAIWQHLASTRFTTPLLRSWVPWLVQRMKEETLLTDCEGFGCDSAVLSLDTDGLDSLVTEGVRGGHLRFSDS